ncbi:cyclase family protein [Rhabdothermincola sediminis]|uniref:cyclase family protein n=1 Tax=Rhabdothermincola sediminis TaxID=2751370 RepID=UPI001AA01CEE|nr:cyclase family protein [Rhabdothermincola sediminis]
MPLSAELQELAARVSNWGRWGEQDERGTANLIDAEAARRGAAAVRTGWSISLTMPLGAGSPQEGGAPRRFNPVHSMLTLNETYTGSVHDACFNDDMVVMALAAGTHIDALAHVTYDGSMYNGFPAESVTAAGGATRCGVDKIGPVVTRGVLLDVPAVKGVERLEPGYAITAEDLDAAVERAKVDLEPGDAVLVRTGHMQLYRQGDVWGYNHDCPGLSTKTIEWVHDHDIGVIVDDTYVFEVWPPEDWASMMPVHMIHLRDMGQLQGQNFDLEDLAAACAEDGIYEFLFTATPEPVSGGCSAPVAAVATR